MPQAKKTASHIAECFDGDDVKIIIKFSYTAEYLEQAPYTTPYDIDEEIEILEAYQEDIQDPSLLHVLDESAQYIEDLLMKNRHLWQEIELEY